MSAPELEIIAGFIKKAVCPEDVFGDLGIARDGREKHLTSQFRKLAKVLHPDIYNGDNASRAIAESTFFELERIREAAVAALKTGTYGRRERLAWKIPVTIKGKYVLESPLGAGHIADLHLASLESSKKTELFLLKIARNANDNDLLHSERLVLEKIHAKMKEKGAKDWPGTIPTIYETFILDDGRSRRRVNVMNHLEGFVNGTEIRRRFDDDPLIDGTKRGVDGRTIAWMWKRLLVLLEWVTKTGFIHGAVIPPHIMFYPDNDGNTTKDVRKHSARLVDWCYAVDYKARTRLSAWVPEYKAFYAPEILAKEKLGPWTDLYMGATTMLFLCGADMAKMEKRESFALVGVPASIINSLGKCLATDPAKRPQSIGDYFEEFSAVVQKEYGKPKYHDFNLPRK
jgi:hypothetical protein